jgi:serine/threonine protein kinase
MSPEIMENQKYNSKTDIWSLGVILYELLCLKMPFDGTSMKQLCYNIVKTNQTPPPAVYSSDLQELSKDLLAKNFKVTRVIFLCIYFSITLHSHELLLVNDSGFIKINI